MHRHSINIFIEVETSLSGFSALKEHCWHSSPCPCISSLVSQLRSRHRQEDPRWKPSHVPLGVAPKPDQSSVDRLGEVNWAMYHNVQGRLLAVSRVHYVAGRPRRVGLREHLWSSGCPLLSDQPRYK